MATHDDCRHSSVPHFACRLVGEDEQTVNTLFTSMFFWLLGNTSYGFTVTSLKTLKSCFCGNCLLYFIVSVSRKRVINPRDDGCCVRCRDRCGLGVTWCATDP